MIFHCLVGEWIEDCLANTKSILETVNRTWMGTTPTDARNIELPLPYFEAVQKLCSLKPVDSWRTISTFLVTRIMWRLKVGWPRTGATQVWSQNLRSRTSNEECGPPGKAGSACWTCIVEILQEHYNLHRPLPFLHYSDCSTMIAAMFATLTCWN